MIHINFERYIKDRVWFGYFWRAGYMPADLQAIWDRSDLWRFKLWPCLKIDDTLPDWWVDLACKFSKDGR